MLLENNNHTSKSKVAILTGATGDLGPDIAKHLASAGYVLCLIGRNKEKLLKVLNELNETNPGNHTIHECDITKKNHRDHTIGEVVSVHGTPDLVINNAAVIGDPKPLTEFTEEEIEKMINTNLTGTVLFTRKVILELLKSGSQCEFLTVGSTAGLYPYPERSIYALTKAGLKNFVESIGPEYKEQGIKTNYLCPGPTEGITINKVIQDRADLKMMSFEQMKKKFSSIVSDNGELLTKEDLLGAIDHIIHGDLDRLAGEVLAGHTIGFDKEGIYDASNDKVIEKNEVIKNIPKEQGIQYDKRRYLLKFSGDKKEQEKSKILYMKFIKSYLHKTTKYAAIIAFLFLAGKAVKINQKAEKFIADFKEREYKIKDFDYEIKRLAKEKYGVDDFDALEQSNDKDAYELGCKIYDEALYNMRSFYDKGFKIKYLELDNMDPYITRDEI